MLYLCPCLALGVFRLYLCYLLFIFIFIFIIINRYFYLFSLLLICIMNTNTLYFAYFLEYVLLFPDGECEQFPNSKSSVSGCCLVFPWYQYQFQLGLAYKNVTYKSVTYTKSVYFTTGFSLHLKNLLSHIYSVLKFSNSLFHLLLQH